MCSRCHLFQRIFLYFNQTSVIFIKSIKNAKCPLFEIMMIPLFEIMMIPLLLRLISWSIWEDKDFNRKIRSVCRWKARFSEIRKVLVLGKSILYRYSDRNGVLWNILYFELQKLIILYNQKDKKNSNVEMKKKNKLKIKLWEKKKKKLSFHTYIFQIID